MSVVDAQTPAKSESAAGPFWASVQLLPSNCSLDGDSTYLGGPMGQLNAPGVRRSCNNNGGDAHQKMFLRPGNSAILPGDWRSHVM